EKAVINDLDRVVEDIREDLRKEKIRYLELKRDGLNGIIVTVMSEEDKKPFKDMVSARYREYEIKDSAPVEKGVRYALLLKQEARNEAMKLATEQARETIENRIDQFGVAEADIRLLQNNRIQIQLPGLKEPERAKELIGQVAELEFKLVDTENSLDEALRGNVPSGREVVYGVSRDRASGNVTRTPYLLKKRSELTGKYITDARVSIDQRDNSPYVSLSFNNQGARIFERVTGENVNRQLAIVLDGNVYSAPNINEKISGGSAQITGRFSLNEAKDLAIALRAGSLPAPVKFLEERTVGPSLGNDSIRMGFLSMIVGAALVVIFMAIYYGFAGLIADLSLVIMVMLVMAGMASFKATLTLPGIAGIILTIGMAVDANVLIFERIREELKLGKTIRAAITAGFSRAIVTIIDANVTTLIVALVLFQFGTGPVKGFAVTLTIGLIATMITQVFITRFIFDYFYTQLNWKKISI
ncbi:MAG: protein translocase subunit SecD, partial [Deltaproteobacteria bacterium]|nr:protein translocase subunit SecD [Deltaproteobacteria bacterium]